MEYAKLYRFISNCLIPFAKVKDFSFHIPIAIGSVIFTGLNSSSVCMSCQLRHP